MPVNEQDDTTYVVTDIEADGPWPGPNSMIAFASVAVTADGVEHSTFEAVLRGLPGAAPDAETYAWFQTQPEDWAAATKDPREPGEVMADYVRWVRGLPRPRVFAAFPLAFDGTWIDYYLRRFTRSGLVDGFYETDRLFDGSGLCLRSYMAAVTGNPVMDTSRSTMPDGWLGEVPHTHLAIDDARGYAHLLGVLLGKARAARTPH
jgi:hypothetical protein